jgi:hypothetical protein
MWKPRELVQVLPHYSGNAKESSSLRMYPVVVPNKLLKPLHGKEKGYALPNVEM